MQPSDNQGLVLGGLNRFILGEPIFLIVVDCNQKIKCVVGLMKFIDV
jgi:hypothetical protein